MDPQVAQTLAALERKLADLERELSALGHGHGGEAASEHAAAPAATAIRPVGSPAGPAPAAFASGAPAAYASGAPAPPMSSPAPPQTAAPHPPAVPGMLVDEALERRYSMEARETVYGEIPATKDERQTIDMAELVRFKETMQRTLGILIDEYSRLLSLKLPTDA